MKQIFILLVCLLSLLQSFAQKDLILISNSYNNISFEVFVKDIYSQTGIRTYYKVEWVEGITVTSSVDSIDIYSFFVQILEKHNLSVTWWHNNLIVTNEKLAFTQIPDFTPFDETIDKDKDSDAFITETEKRYLAGRRPDVIETITIGSLSTSRKSAKARVRGRIRDDDSGEPLIGATMFIEEVRLGVASDQNGYFKFALEPGTYNAKFDCIGQKSTVYQLNILSDGEFSVNIEKSILQIDEVVIYGDKSVSIITRDAGLEKIPIVTLKELPMMMGERDIIRVSEHLPGIVSVGEGSSGINVRGGNFDQNGFYINKVPIYNTSHVFGFFPAFNPDIVKDFSIYKGHIPAEFGGRLSSIFNVITKQGNSKRFNVRGGVNPVTSNLTLEGPIIKDKGSALLSLRSSYSDWILSRINEPDIRNSKAKFSDIAFTTTIDPSSRSQFNLFSYYSTDQFKLSNINQYDYTNLGASADWRFSYTPFTRSEISLIASQYSFNTIDENIPFLAYRHNYKISHYEFRSSLSHLFNDKNKIESGISLIGYHLDKGQVTPHTDESFKVPVDLGMEKGFEGSFFFSDTYNPIHWLNLYLGFRYSAFAPLGESTVYKYFPNQPLDFRYIMDTIYYKNLQPEKWYHGPEFRISANIRTDSRGSIKLAFNQTRQNLFMLNNTFSISPNTQWKIADSHLKPAIGKQISLGVFRDFPKHSLEASAEVFLKQTDNFSEFKDGASFIETPYIETMVIQGNQEAYGLELMLRKTSGRFNGWIAYTYSRSIVEIDGQELWMKINDGDPYPSNYDIPHVLNFVANYRFSRRANFSTTATYQQGRPITYPMSIYYIDGIPIIDYSKRNEFRIPDYFRIDVSLAIEGNLKREKLFHSSWVIGVYNATGRKNPLSIYFKSEDGKLKGYKYSVIGAPIFTVTWVFKLGNYAAD
jgi:hypothetical protein